MNAGTLPNLITIQARSTTQDSYGAPVDTWAEIITVFAKVEQIRGREYFSEGRIAADVDTRVVMRYQSGIRPKQRILFESRVLDIQHVIVDQKKTVLEILAKEAA